MAWIGLNCGLLRHISHNFAHTDHTHHHFNQHSELGKKNLHIIINKLGNKITRRLK